MKQQDQENIDSFVTTLRTKANNCEFGQLKEQLIKDMIVLGVNNE